MDIFKKNYMPDGYKELLEEFQYEKRVGSYYVFREEDGYINISFEIWSSEPYKFYKNIYQKCENKLHQSSNYQEETELFGHRITTTPASITATFISDSSLKNFLSSYHKKIGRKLKLNKLKNGIK